MKILTSIVLLLNISFGFAQNYTIKNLDMNDDKSQYGVVYYEGDQMYFTSYLLD